MPQSSRPRHPRRPQHASGAMPAHAHLLASDGHVVGGAALRGEEWVLVLRGTVVAAVDSAAMVIAMLRHTALSLGGLTVKVSETLRTRASAEAASHDLELEAYLSQLEVERRERLAERSAGGGAPLQ